MADKLGRLAINNEGFIFDPETGESYGVNPTGLFIIEKLKENLEKEKIVKEMTEQFSVSEEEAEKDLYDFLEHLRLLGLLEEQDV